MVAVIKYQTFIPPLKLLAPKINVARAKTEADRFASTAKKALQKYPGKPSGSRYRRTQDLKRGWMAPVSFTNDLKIDIFNDVDYAGYVQGRRFTGAKTQMPRFKRGGWLSLTDVNREIWPVFQARIALALGIPLRQIRNIRIPRD